MAAREEAATKHSAADSMEEETISWRREVDRNLTRLHSLQFGADLAMQKKDPSSAQILNLRLLGFLHSNLHTEADEAFIRPIIRETVSKINVARGLLVPESDRQAFEQAGKSQGPVFGIKGDIDIENFKNSKYFNSILKQSEFETVKANKVDNQDKLNRKISKVMVQAKLTSLYGNSFSRPNDRLDKSYPNTRSDNSDDCVILEKSQSYQKHHRSSRIFTSPKLEEERVSGISLPTKRGHVEIRSTENDIMKSPFNNNETNIDNPCNGFVTAKTQLEKDAKQKQGLAGSSFASPQSNKNCINKNYGVKSYGFPRRGIRGNFVPPIRSNEGNTGNMTSQIAGKPDDSIGDSIKRCLEVLCGPDGELPEKLRNLEPLLIEQVSNEIMDRDPNVRWDDIAGLEHAKNCVTEMVIWPLLRPDIFKGCRSPGKGLLLFGPPGTGKTMIGKAIAGEAKATFFYISASSLTSKWIGEGEKLVRALFAVACCRQPAVIFVDEIDSLLSQRKSEGEHESSRRLKTQFLIEMEGFDSGSEQILLIGATNRPQELDEAARRRLTKRLYIPLPSKEARAWIIRNMLEKDELFKLSQEDLNAICVLTEGYSGSDMKNLVNDASMGPLRDALKGGIEITMLKKEDMRPVTLQDFKASMNEVRASVSPTELGTYEQWNKQFGSIAI